MHSESERETGLPQQPKSDQATPRYAYICTNYNNAHHTREAVRTINSGDQPPQQIVVVDNQSSTEDISILASIAAEHKNVDLVLNQENIGYFSGLNVGIVRMRIIDPGIQTMVIGNNDLEFPENFGACLALAINNIKQRPVISPYVETLDGIPQNPHVVTRISRTRELIYDLYYANYHLAKIIRLMARQTHSLTDRRDETTHNIARYIYQGHGSCYILTETFFQEFNELWAPTFMMGEEFFLSHQLSERGFKTYYDPRVQVRHRCNGSIKNVPAFKMWQLARDAHRVYRRYVSPWRRQNSINLPRTH